MSLQTDDEGKTDGALESIRAFARRVGRSHPTIIQAIAEGRITAVERDAVTGRVVGVDWQRAVQEYVTNTDPVQAERSGAAPLNTSPAKAPAEVSESATSSGQRESRPAAPGPLGGELFDPQDAQGGQVGGGEQAGKPGKDDQTGYLESRAKREKFLAQQAELEYLERVGALVSVQAVEKANEEIWSELKNNVFRIIPKKSAVIAAETDPARVERLLTDALNQAFHESSRAFADAAAGGIEGRAPALP